MIYLNLANPILKKNHSVKKVIIHFSQKEKSLLIVYKRVKAIQKYYIRSFTHIKCNMKHQKENYFN